MQNKYPDPSKALPIEDNVVLNKTASQIDWRGEDKAEVRCTDGSSFAADHVIVAVSLGVLKSVSETLFEPQLPPRKANAIENLGFGTVNKIFLKFSEKWWPDDCRGFSFVWNDGDRSSVLDGFGEGGREVSAKIDRL